MSLKDELQNNDKLSQKEMGEFYGKTKTRFFYYVEIPSNPNDCWEWIGYKLPNGYGRFRFNRKKMYAHRVSHILFKGYFDPKLCCLHKCDNPGCVNPDHLLLGTNHDNMKDMKQKGRSAKGEENGRSKLTEEEVKEIKSLLAHGKSCAEIGRLFKVTHGHINKIKLGKAWKHIK